MRSSKSEDRLFRDLQHSTATFTADNLRPYGRCTHLVAMTVTSSNVNDRLPMFVDLRPIHTATVNHSFYLIELVNKKQVFVFELCSRRGMVRKNMTWADFRGLV